MLLEDAEEVGLADRMPLLVQALPDLAQGQVLAAQADDLFGELLALGGRLPPRASDDEELGQVGLTGEVSDDGADRVGVKREAFGQLLCRGALGVVGLANLVVALSDEGRGAEQIGQLRGASHGSWVGNKQVRAARSREAPLASEVGIDAAKGREQAENRRSEGKSNFRGGEKTLTRGRRYTPGNLPVPHPTRTPEAPAFPGRNERLGSPSWVPFRQVNGTAIIGVQGSQAGPDGVRAEAGGGPATAAGGAG